MITPRRLRSLLFVPADRAERIAKAAAAAPDAVLVDLEDAVAPSRLKEARRGVAEALRALPSRDAVRLVRVHAAGHAAMEEDVRAVVGPWLDGLMLPKADDPSHIRRLDDALAGAERDRGLTVGATAVIPLVESCAGLRHTYAMCRASARIVAMAFSSGEEGDFMADLGGRWTPDGRALEYARSAFLNDVRAAGVPLAVDGVCMHLDDIDILRSECAIGATLGYDGKLAIHPKQVSAIHEAFTPSPQDVAGARRLLAVFAAAGPGAGVVRHEGGMADVANLRVARRILARAGAEEAP